MELTRAEGEAEVDGKHYRQITVKEQSVDRPRVKKELNRTANRPKRKIYGSGGGVKGGDYLSERKCKTISPDISKKSQRDAHRVRTQSL